MMTSSSSGGQINVAASAQKIKVDNRFSLSFYYRIADNILKQADIFRAEGNIVDLYIMLLRFLSLATETIPCHRDYRGSLQYDKVSLKKKSLNAVSELEDLKPAVRLKINELARKNTYQSNGWNQRSSLDSSIVKRQNFGSYTITKAPQVTSQEYAYQVPRIQQSSLSIPRPREETLSRHSILGPNGLRGQWQAPSINMGVRYPSNIDFTPVEIPSDFPRDNRLQPVEDSLSIKNDSEVKNSSSESTLVQKDDHKMNHIEELASLISFEAVETAEIIRQPSPPPVLADVQDLGPKTSPSANGTENSLSDGLACSETPLELHISTAVMDSFLRMAKSNTDINLETCGILAGLLKNRKFYVTALIIPKQESTSDSCSATNEEEIFEVQDKQSLFPLGWIHTHPTQSCFMSSIDVHTHYSYQVMLPEAIAIVMAPRDSSRKHGIFRLTTPGGMSVIRGCPRRGFHAHDPPSDGSPIYKQCTDVFLDPKLKFDVIDLR